MEMPIIKHAAEILEKIFTYLYVCIWKNKKIEMNLELINSTYIVTDPSDEVIVENIEKLPKNSKKEHT